jgi:hypothetical protein
MITFLTEKGLLENQAVKVVDNVVSCNWAIAEIEHRSHDGYPPAMNSAIALALSTSAVEWIDEHMPKHFARPMFAPPSET